MSVVPRDVELGGTAFARSALLVVTMLVVHIAFLSQIQILGVRPETLQLLTIVTAVQAGSQLGAGTGVLAGLAEDMYASTPLGYGSLTLGLVGFAVGFARDRAFAGSERYAWPLVALGSVAATSLMGALVIASDSSAAGYRFGRLGLTIIVSAVMNLFMLIPMQWLVRRIIHGV
jgi:rod shape-determining protein MreD